ncbi:threonine aldolase family protein [Mycolicibacterium chubuense]|uniref:Low specificity L-threonine aldolase n=1 Tax=Mycolicibacterium chubuense TaxID=1800 RepID=A0A0J6WFV6_MYCCU|nr:beta-eliminating lyase-related protein [Mycolicibacterium chubuense]KMO82130.1 Low specificity L-threonine aldolase [Mycolicibacterium chubuense]SPX99923.1 L-threonine aldolase [Mycolicibacterium chubuense]
MANVPVSAAFASDNAAPAHPAALDALARANDGPAPSYGDDAVTAQAADALREAFDSPGADVLYAFTGTAANIIALASAVQPWHEILCSDVAHVLLDEAGGPVRLSGAQLTRLPSVDGLIAVDELDRRVARRGPVHHSQPRIVTITQSTENGRVWQAPDIKGFVDHAHDLGLLVHVDGSRVANAIAAQQVSPIDAVGDADVVTVGGTKNGMLFGDAILVRRPEHFDGIAFVQKQIGHLASKHRYVAAQFLAFLTDDLWLQNAAHANAMARTLGDGLEHLGFALASPVEANEVFVRLDPDAIDRLSRSYTVHQPDLDEPVWRLVCSWATTSEDVDGALAALR